jgi:hypothetical protein
MNDKTDDEPELTAEELDERSQAVTRASTVAYVWWLAPPGSIWDRRIWKRPEWRSGILH